MRVNLARQSNGGIKIAYNLYLPTEEDMGL